LKSTVKAAWTSLGVKEITDVNCGNQIGIAGGRTFAAKREVVVDPQLLMLSGMG
jgi:hypothetical protein